MMRLFSGPLCLYGHTCRIVMQEKIAECDFRYLGEEDIEQELAELNPYGESPTLVDRDLVLYSPVVINEYLDERLPHPPLMPIDPVGRGRARLLISRLQRDWLDDLQRRLAVGQKLDQKSRKCCGTDCWQCPRCSPARNIFWAMISLWSIVTSRRCCGDYLHLALTCLSREKVWRTIASACLNGVLFRTA